MISSYLRAIFLTKFDNFNSTVQNGMISEGNDGHFYIARSFCSFDKEFNKKIPRRAKRIFGRKNKNPNSSTSFHDA